MPVAVSPIDWKIWSVLRELVLDRSDQFSRLLIDRTLAIEVVVVFRDGEHSLARDVASAEHVFEEGNHVVVAFGTAERNNQECVVAHASDENVTKNKVYLKDENTSFEAVSFWEIVEFGGIPLPLPSIGIIDLGENSEIIYGAQRLTGKILSRKDLGGAGLFPPAPLSPWQFCAFTSSKTSAEITGHCDFVHARNTTLEAGRFAFFFFTFTELACAPPITATNETRVGLSKSRHGGIAARLRLRGDSRGGCPYMGLHVSCEVVGSPFGLRWSGSGVPYGTLAGLGSAPGAEGAGLLSVAPPGRASLRQRTFCGARPFGSRDSRGGCPYVGRAALLC